jgi:pyruvate/2-oxoacid:ferredoxin oxidoreductase beta subunit
MSLKKNGGAFVARLVYVHFDILIYLLTAIGMTPGGSSTVHIYTQNNTQNDTKQSIHRTTQHFWKSAGRAPSWRVIPWHLPYN